MKTCKTMPVREFFAPRVIVADSYFTRLRGLMFRKQLAEGECLLLENCSSIHCCFMNFPIDVVYLSQQMEVLKVETVRPWRVGSIVRGAKHVLETSEGAASALKCGDILIFEEMNGNYE